MKDIRSGKILTVRHSEQAEVLTERKKTDSHNKVSNWFLHDP